VAIDRNVHGSARLDFFATRERNRPHHIDTKAHQTQMITTDTHCKVGTIPWTAVISGTLGTTSFFPTSSAVSTTSPSAPSTPFKMFPSPSTSALADAALNCLTLLAEDDEGVGWLKGAGVETRPEAEGVGAVAYEGRAGGGMATLEGGRADMMVRFLVDDELVVQG
jgi:hypothetical protein